jgi:putative effector of murein hydrolase
MLGFRRKRTNLHEKYDYPALAFAALAIGLMGVATVLALPLLVGWL